METCICASSLLASLFPWLREAGVVITPFYRWRNRVTERGSDLPEATQRVKGGVKARTREV